MTFRVGQKVVCVDSFGPSSSGSSAPWDDGEALINGEIYTIASIHRDNYGVPVVWLIEIARTKNARAFHGPLCGYGPHRFRPLIDISDLAAIVTEVMKNRTRTITPDKFDHARTKVGAMMWPFNRVTLDDVLAEYERVGTFNVGLAVLAFSAFKGVNLMTAPWDELSPARKMAWLRVAEQVREHAERDISRKLAGG